MYLIGFLIALAVGIDRDRRRQFHGSRTGADRWIGARQRVRGNRVRVRRRSAAYRRAVLSRRAAHPLALPVAPAAGRGSRTADRHVCSSAAQQSTQAARYRGDPARTSADRFLEHHLHSSRAESSLRAQEFPLASVARASDRSRSRIFVRGRRRAGNRAAAQLFGDDAAGSRRDRHSVWTGARRYRQRVSLEVRLDQRPRAGADCSMVEFREW